MKGKIEDGKEQNHGREKLSINTKNKGRCEQKRLLNI